MLADRIGGPALSLFRAVIGLLFLCHGLASLFGVLGGNRGTGEPVPLGQWPGWWAALIQAVCGALVLAGLLTRPAALVASGSMAYAYFVVHQPDALLPLRNGGELAALFCWSFLLVAALGPGPWAIDTLLRGQRTAAASTPDGVSVPA
ncbi:putative oxidoreductase [Micromonospora nigra]|uniref:Putative oxidoreductase n=1 Tax=Micromonospora nigra TaxID=145857 RepID=A0A1C6RUM8_9ACTN|nr:DoxX family protein [Micromonospora nigra]SCL20719.1 putative oxidoreductase [Micromonospora nigra]